MASNDLHKQLRKALNHLYNPDYLRTCPLAAWLGITGRFNTPKALQGILLHAIETLKHRPAGSRDERRIFYYDLLHFRYVDKLSQEEVANQLGVSTRQFAREQDHSIDLLSIILTEQYPVLASKWTFSDSATSDMTTRQDELDWQDFAPQGQPVNFAAELEIVLNLIDPLIKQRAMQVERKMDALLPNLSVHPIALRQVMLSMITMIIHQAVNSQIWIEVEAAGQWMSIVVQGQGSSGQPESQLTREDQDSLEIARMLIRVNQGDISMHMDEAGFGFRLRLPIFQYQIVLVIDDHPDFIQLVQRYMLGTRYQVVSAQDPVRADEQAIAHAARFILLDVMMPNVDGWQVLGLLRRNPRTAHIPVIICTIVAQEELAYALGASAFLRKPLRQDILIETLNRLSQPELYHP